jgi:ABC-type phosphate transport system substrate-binding protein
MLYFQIHYVLHCQLNDKEISRLFLGKMTQDEQGNKIVPVNHKVGSEVRNEFESKALKKSATQIKAYWSKQLFSGKGKPPKELLNDQDVIDIISKNKNAIGYINANSYKENANIKIIKRF